MNDGTSSQDDDGYYLIDEELKTESAKEAVKLFEARIEELKRATRSDGNRRYERIDISLEMTKGNTITVIKKTSLAFENCVVEEVITFKPGRGWIESKKKLNLEGSARLKNGNLRRKFVRSEP